MVVVFHFTPFLFKIMGAGMLAVGIYNIISIQSYEDFSRGVYITGGVLFVLIGVAKIVLSILGIIGWGTGMRILLYVVRYHRNDYILGKHTYYNEGPGQSACPVL